MEDFSSATIENIAKLALDDRRKLGQFMTPQHIGMRMAALFTPKADGEPLKVLDPAVGTAELLRSVQHVHGDDAFEFHGWDVDPGMLVTAQRNIPLLSTRERSIFTPLDNADQGTFDYIIGNPPYFELKKDCEDLAGCDLRLKSNKGRLNIYALFFEYSLKLLKPDGEMVFLVPPSMNNGAYFSLLRQIILENAEVRYMEVIVENNKFQDALTSVQIIHLKKTSAGYEANKKASSKYLVDFNELNENVPVQLPVIFTPNKKTLMNAWKNAHSLHDLGYKVITGKTIWNQNKNMFQDATAPNVAPLVYSKDITETNKLKLVDKLDDRRWLPASRPDLLKGNLIVVNRIVGALTAPRIKAALVEETDYPDGVFGENHVNVILPVSEEPSVNLETVLERLTDSAVISPYIKALTGNTQISATELMYLIPIKG
jgi:adenine-specific DNA-methyltransferase